VPWRCEFSSEWETAAIPAVSEDTNPRQSRPAILRARPAVAPPAATRRRSRRTRPLHERREHSVHDFDDGLATTFGDSRMGRDVSFVIIRSSERVSGVGWAKGSLRVCSSMYFHTTLELGRISTDVPFGI